MKTVRSLKSIKVRNQDVCRIGNDMYDNCFLV
jgi:hypothetical protein